jgi:negative regulator of sigma E activity
MWVDREFYLVIGTQVEDQSGEVVRSSRYVSLQLNPDDISPSLFEVRGKIRPAMRHSTCNRMKMLKPSYLPPGYRMIGSSCLCMRGRDCAHLQFGNGANTISLFERKAGREAPPQPVASKVTNVLTWARDGMRFTLMGDVPKAELQRIAESVK